MMGKRAAARIATFRRPAELTMEFEKDKAATRSIDNIKPRAGLNTRGLNPQHVVTLAESMFALGLIEPIVIDEADHLLAGGHRLASARLLASDTSSRAQLLAELCEEGAVDRRVLDHLSDLGEGSGELKPHALPVVVLPFRSADEPDRALAIETAENEKRRNYTSTEVRDLLERLKEAGYRTEPGRPKKGERAALPVIAAVVGKSKRHVLRLLRTEEETVTHVTVFGDKQIKALERIGNSLPDASEPNIKKALKHIGLAISALKQARKIQRKGS